MKRIFYLVLAFLIFSFVSCAGDSKIEKSEASSPVIETPTPPVEEEKKEEAPETKTEEKPSEEESTSENQDENAQNDDSETSETSDSETETFDFENAEVLPEGEGFFISKNEEEIKKENEKPPVVVTEKEVIEPEKPVVVETPKVVNPPSVSETKTETKVEEKQNEEITRTENDSVALETSENETPLEEDSEIEEIEKLPIIPSRSVKILKGQYLDVNYPGTGWVYLGEIDENGNGDKKLTYFGRKLGSENTTFTLRSRNPGTATLHFYKNDSLTGTYIDDYLEVIIEDRVASSSTVRTTAPSYAEVVPKKPEKVVKIEKKELQKDAEPEKRTESAKKTRETEKKSTSSSSSTSASKTDAADNKKGTTIVQTSESEPSYSSPSVPSPIPTPKVSTPPAKTENSPSQIALPEKEDELLAYAKKCYDDKKFVEALAAVQKYLDISGSKTDEALYLQGLIYESDSSVRNIRNAIDCFDSVVKNYPASEVWQKSRNRSIYLKRFYVEIR